MSDYGEAVYSRRYARVRVFADRAAADWYVRKAFAHVGRFAVRVEWDGTYLYRADAEGFAAGSPLAGFAVTGTEVLGVDMVPRNNATAGGSDKMRRWL